LFFFSANFPFSASARPLEAITWPLTVRRRQILTLVSIRWRPLVDFVIGIGIVRLVAASGNSPNIGHLHKTTAQAEQAGSVGFAGLQFDSDV
jgi:hypothetical protein